MTTELIRYIESVSISGIGSFFGAWAAFSWNKNQKKVEEQRQIFGAINYSIARLMGIVVTLTGDSPTRTGGIEVKRPIRILIDQSIAEYQNREKQGFNIFTCQISLPPLADVDPKDIHFIAQESVETVLLLERFNAELHKLRNALQRRNELLDGLLKTEPKVTPTGYQFANSAMLMFPLIDSYNHAAAEYIANLVADANKLMTMLDAYIRAHISEKVYRGNRIHLEVQ